MYLILLQKDNDYFILSGTDEAGSPLWYALNSREAQTVKCWDKSEFDEAVSIKNDIASLDEYKTHLISVISTEELANKFKIH